MPMLEEATDRELVLQSLRHIKKLRHEIEVERGARSEPIAIVGIGCRFPGGADSPAKFWSLLQDGFDAVADMGDRRWVMNEVFDPNPHAPGKMYTRRAALLDQIDQFDAELFGISDREAEAMDPQQRLLLEVSREAVEHAGYAPRTLAGSATGVFVSLMNIEYATLAREITPYLGAGNALSVAAGRISYLLGLHGPCMAVDTACSASVLTVHLGCQSLRARECNLALAGGANLLISPATSIAESKAMMLSRRGSCRTFDASADGYVRGEGCGIILLKRLSDAQKAGDTIHAIIRGSAVNHDGATQGLTAPSGTAQTNVIGSALTAANVDPRTVTYIEAHGTGTELGDPIECNALDRTYGVGRGSENRIWVGSVKTNIGHLESAAGIAGLIKSVLMLKNRRIAPHLHLNRINPHIKWQPCFAVATKCIPWDSESGPRRAGLSSFGFSGTNLHLILEEAGEPSSQPSSVSPNFYLLAISARTAQGLSRLISQYIDLLEDCDFERLADICFTASVGRDHFQYRLAVVGADCRELRSRLVAALVMRHTPTKLLRSAPKLALMVHVATDAAPDGLWSSLMCEPVFRDTLQHVDAAYQRSPRQALAAEDEELLRVLSRYLGIGALFRDWISEPALWIVNDKKRSVAIVASGAIELAEELAGILGEKCRRDAEDRSRKSAAVCAADQAEVFKRLQGAGVEAVIHIGVPEGIALSIVSSESGWPTETGLAGRRDANPHRQALDAVANAYQRGWAVRWEKTHGDRRNRRVPIPLHPFERKRHWFDQGEPLSFTTSRPRQLSAVRGQDGQAFFEEMISAPTVSEHRLFGPEVVPAAHHVAFVVEAVRQLFGARTCRLRDVAFVEPLTLAGSPRVLQLMIRPESGTTGVFSIASRPQLAELDEHWTNHATGSVDWRPSITTSCTSPELSVIQSMWSTVQQPDAYYSAAERRGLALGPAFRWLGAGFRSENSAVRMLVQPAARCQAATRFNSLDPSMLDACFHVLISCLGENGEAVGDQLFIPTGISEVVVHSDTDGGRRFCRAQPKSISADRAVLDFQLCHEDGSVALEVSGLSLRPLPAQRGGGDDRHERAKIGQLLYRRAWRALPLKAEPEVIRRQVLILGQASDLCRLVAERLMSLGFSVRVAVWSERSEVGAKEEHRIDPMEREHLIRLFNNLSAADRVPTDIVWLCDAWEPGAGVTLTGLKQAHRQACLPLLHLAQTISSIALPARCRLWVVSAVAEAVSTPLISELAQAPVSGMLKSLSIELYPGVACTCVEIQQDDPAMQAALLAGELAGGGEAADVAYRGGDRYESRLVPARDVVAVGLRFDNKGTYLVTGASGGIGGTLARWLVERGVCNLVLISRGGAALLREELGACLGAGGTVLDFQLDIADAAAVTRLVRDLRQRMPPLKGVFHAAGVLDDALLNDQNWQRFELVMEPKVAGAWNLHHAMLDDPLEFFVLFSSASSIFGAPGQVNYAAANAFLDGLAEYRRANGLAGCSINWGPWSDVGMSMRLDAPKKSWFSDLGIAPIAPPKALEALDAIIASASTSITVIDCDWTKAVSRIGAGFTSELVNEIPRQSGAETRFSTLRTRLAEATAEQRAELLLTECKRAVEEILKEKVSDDNLHWTLIDLGLDSLAALRLRYGLHEELGVDIPLTHLLGELTIVALADRIGEEWSVESRLDHSGPRSPGRAAAGMLTEIEL
jgi:acyl transferase domain-containing protein/acyl carrier protein